MKGDPRVAELLELVADGVKLPMPPSMIVWFEDRGKLVDLVTGEVYDTVAVQTTSQAQAVAYLLCEVVGEVAL